jgi:DNA-binding transcriptional LysR family regulator
MQSLLARHYRPYANCDPIMKDLNAQPAAFATGRSGLLFNWTSASNRVARARRRMWTRVPGCDSIAIHDSLPMRFAAMADLDIRLLRVFLEIYETKNISQAAVVLGLSQPTISIHLSKLRTHFGDQLFVRSSQGMEATPFAIDLHSYAVKAVSSLEAASNLQSHFDPRRSDRTFRIATTDISHIVLLPRMLNRLGELAPHINLQISHIGQETAGMLETGEMDIAVGFMPQLDAGFYQQKMFKQRYLCIAAKGHGYDTTPLTVESFLKASHVRVISGGTGHFIVEKLLRDQQIQRRIALEVPNYLGLLEIVARTQLLAIVPEGLTRAIKPEDGLHVLELPRQISLPEYHVKQHWHERNHRDPAHRWLRRAITDLFLDRQDTALAALAADDNSIEEKD